MIDYLNIDINGLTEPFLYLVLELDNKKIHNRQATPFYTFIAKNNLLIAEFKTAEYHYVLIKYLDYIREIPYAYKGLSKYLRFQPVHKTVKAMWEPIKLFYDDKGEYKNDK